MGKVAGKGTEDKSTGLRDKLGADIFGLGDVSIAMIQQLIPLGLMMFREVLNEEVERLTGERYVRGDGIDLSRWGSNPGSITLAGQRLKIQVPRVRNKRDRKEVKLESYQALSGRDTFDETVFKQMIHGVSTRDYKKAVDLMPEAFGVSKSAVSEGFKRESVKKLKELLERDLKEDDIVAFLVDGKYLEDTQILVVLGVLSDGTKKVLGFSETNTENTVACKELLKDLVRRGMSTDVPRLAVVDGAKGLNAAIKEVFGNNAIIQRCQNTAMSVA